MNTFIVTRQDEIFPRSNSEQLFQIQDDLLFDCIGIGKACSNDPNRVTGFNCGKRFGYALLTYFLSRALNIQRLPFWKTEFILTTSTITMIVMKKKY